MLAQFLKREREREREFCGFKPEYRSMAAPLPRNHASPIAA